MSLIFSTTTEELFRLAWKPAFEGHMLSGQPWTGTSGPYRPHKGPLGLYWEICDKTTDTQTLRLLYMDVDISTTKDISGGGGVDGFSGG